MAGDRRIRRAIALAYPPDRAGNRSQHRYRVLGTVAGCRAGHASGPVWPWADIRIVLQAY